MSLSGSINPERRAPLTLAQCELLLTIASAFDGRDVGEVNIGAWYEACMDQRWSDFDACRKAVTNYYSRAAKPGERLWVMPGHVTEYVRANNRQPEQFDRAALEGPPPAASETRRLALEELIASLANRKRVPASYGDVPTQRADPKIEAAQKRAAEREAQEANWAAVDGCDLCDDEGMRLASQIVCTHVAAA